MAHDGWRWPRSSGLTTGPGRFLGAAASISLEREVRLIGLLADPAAPGGWQEVAMEPPLP
jgi:hypothetical protein